MRLQFILSEIGIGLRRNLAMSISVVLVTFVSLTFVGAAALLQQQISQMKDDWYDKVEVSVFLCAQGSEAPSCASGEVTEEQKDAIEAELESPEIEPYVQTVYFETKEQAYESFQDTIGDQWWAAEVTAADMQSSYRIKLADPEQYQVVADVLTGRQGVEEVLDQRRLFDSLFTVLNRATIVSIGIAGIMLLAAVLLITTTIRLSAMSRRRETGIMRLVGASNLFIQLPFMLEGAIAATIGAALAVGALWLGVRYLVTDWLGGQVSWIDYVDSADVLTIAPVLLAVAIVLAVISSVVTLSRYTKV
ncbi:permease-like cell division protein FtsX [Cellulomonas sp. ATA003]|uniref:permease-like cell division protein FtsX n=1 Tax=Cellulomonas sp. ATA003 TaxID=3073064 RepID=UPI0028732AC8|nr:permease-like cell division protein FtsX [Cellulomonas sp. ATA003]WNB86428.1 permease-like cell division protein FtsX [Cellulomonas sp. ATA003]